MFCEKCNYNISGKIICKNCLKFFESKCNLGWYREHHFNNKLFAKISHYICILHEFKMNSFFDYYSNIYNYLIKKDSDS